MANLVPCKSCKKDVDKNAKTCPHCGASSPGTSAKETAKGCLGFIVLAIVISIIINSCDKDPAPATKPPIIEQQENNAKTINDANFDDLIIEMNNDYIASVESLFKHYDLYKDLDPSVFINWRNNEWTPKYENSRKRYDAILEKNRLYISSQGGFRMFIAFSDLYLLSIDVMKSIHKHDKSYLKSAGQRFKSDGGFFDELVKSRGLEDKVN